jgi:hypothetical protein
MILRRMTNAGMDAFRAWLTQVKSEPSLAAPHWLLTDLPYSEELPVQIEIEPREFSNRLEAAQYLDAKLSNSGLTGIDRDPGLWAWLTLLYIDQVCPMKKGKRTIGDITRYIPVLGGARRYYRHLLFGPWMMLRAHADNPSRLLGLLSSPMDVATSETFRLFIENPSLISSNAAVAATTRLYFDQETQKLKRGAGSKDNGGCRRLIEFLQQIDLTYDLAGMQAEDLLKLLPNEFRRFVR